MSPAVRRSAPIKEEVVPPTPEELAEDAAAEAADQKPEREPIALAAVQDPDVVDAEPEPEDGLEAAEIEAEHVGIALAAITGHAGPIVDQRELLADEAVEQRRLADIGTADDSDGGETRHSGRP